jgi:hypothetical protein
MGTRRKIVVDDIAYTWEYGGPGVVVRDSAKGKWLAPVEEVTGIGLAAFERGQRKRTRDGMVTPFDVANWIRARVHGKPKLRRPPSVARRYAAPATPAAPARSPLQPDVYVVERVTYWEDDGCEVAFPVEAHLDPQAAIDRAAALNAAERRLRALHEELYRRVFAAYDTISGDAERQAAGRRIEEGFFAENGVVDEAERERVLRLGCRSPRYAVGTLPLFA